MNKKALFNKFFNCYHFSFLCYDSLKGRKINTIILENHTNAKNIVKMNVYLTNADYLGPLRKGLGNFLW